MAFSMWPRGSDEAACVLCVCAVRVCLSVQLHFPWRLSGKRGRWVSLMMSIVCAWGFLTSRWLPVGGAWWLSIPSACTRPLLEFQFWFGQNGVLSACPLAPSLALPPSLSASFLSPFLHALSLHSA